MTQTTSPQAQAAAAGTTALAPITEKLVLDTPDRDLARKIAGALQDLLEPPPDALTLFEAGADWRIEAYFYELPDPAQLTEHLAALIGQPIPPLTREVVPDLNWVALSQAALPPVEAGRFKVHGSHDRGRIPRGPGAITIDAGEAFGTAHHATTLGCLLAIDRLSRSPRRYRSILDLGCGSGVLAIALARTEHCAKIMASDLDARSIEVARDNARLNGVAAHTRFLVASGLDHPRLRGPGRYDLIVANILAAPLIAMAPRLSQALRQGGTLVLSGLLVPQAPQVIASYRAAGFSLATHNRISGWSTLVLRRR